MFADLDSLVFETQLTILGDTAFREREGIKSFCSISYANSSMGKWSSCRVRIKLCCDFSCIYKGNFFFSLMSGLWNRRDCYCVSLSQTGDLDQEKLQSCGASSGEKTAYSSERASQFCKTLPPVNDVLVQFNSSTLYHLVWKDTCDDVGLT